MVQIHSPRLTEDQASQWIPLRGFFFPGPAGRSIGVSCPAGSGLPKLLSTGLRRLRSCSMGICRGQNSEEGMTGYVGKGQINSVRAGVDSNRVRPGSAVPPELGERVIPFLEYRHDS